MKKKFKAAVEIDSWKLDIFKNVLDVANYTYEQQSKGLTKDTITLIVHYNNLHKLKKVIRRANTQAALMKDDNQDSTASTH